MKILKGIYYNILFEYDRILGRLLKICPHISFLKPWQWNKSQVFIGDFKTDSVQRAKVTHIVPYNASLDYLKPEYDKIRELKNRIQKNVFIANVKSPLQRAICNSEIQDLIASEKSLEFYSNKRLQKMGKRITRFPISTDTFLDENKGTIYKSKDIFYYDRLRENTPGDSIYEYLLHNILFPNVPFTLLGRGELDNKPTFVYSQPYIRNVLSATDDEIDSYMDLMGFYRDRKRDEYSFSCYRDIYLSIFVKRDYVLSDMRGNLYFTNSVISFSRPPKDVFKYYMQNNV